MLFYTMRTDGQSPSKMEQHWSMLGGEYNPIGHIQKGNGELLIRPAIILSNPYGMVPKGKLMEILLQRF